MAVTASPAIVKSKSVNPLLFLQQALRHLVFRGRSGPIDIGEIADLNKPLDPLARVIRIALLAAVRDGATEIRFIPNGRYIQLFRLVKDHIEELWPLPLFRNATAPITQNFRRLLQGTTSQQVGNAVEQGTIHVGGHPVHLSVFTTASQHGDVISVRIVDPGLAKPSPHQEEAVRDEDWVVQIECFGEDGDCPSFDSSEALWEWCRESLLSRFQRYM
jgi:hypothetical protein